jgi:ABC-type phosphate/phosphonate transport system ATPase subunit
MRIERLDLIRYGHFTGYAIDLPVRQPDFTVMYGDNEAGKSTLLRGISALFFGVPPKTPDVHAAKVPNCGSARPSRTEMNVFRFDDAKGAVERYSVRMKRRLRAAF